MNKLQIDVVRELNCLDEIGCKVPRKAYKLITDPKCDYIFQDEDWTASSQETSDFIIQLATL